MFAHGLLDAIISFILDIVLLVVQVKYINGQVEILVAPENAADARALLAAADGQIQLGYNLNSRRALYADLMAGLGSDRPYDWGVGAGIRFIY